MLNARNGVGNLYRSQAAAAREGSVADGGDGVPNAHRRQAAATLECTVADFGDWVGIARVGHWSWDCNRAGIYVVVWIVILSFKSDADSGVVIVYVVKDAIDLEIVGGGGCCT